MGAKSMESLKSNLFLTREAYLEAFETIMTPLKTAILTSEKPGVNFGSSGAVYDQQHAEMEALIRPLWGIGPYWVACKELIRHPQTIGAILLIMINILWKQQHYL